MRFQLLDKVGLLSNVLEYVKGEAGDVNSTLQYVTQTARSLFGADGCVLLTINPITNHFGALPTIEGDVLAEEIAVERPETGNLAQQVLERGMLLVENLKNSPEYQHIFAHSEHICSFAAIVLWMRDRRRPLGILYLNFRQSGQFSSSDQELLGFFAKQASFLLQRTWLLWRYQEVARIGKEINHELATVDDLFQKLPPQIASILDASQTLLLAVYLPQNSTLDMYITEEENSFLLKNEPLEGACQYVLETRQSLFIQCLSEQVDLPFQRVSIAGTGAVESLIFVPLLLRDQPLGILSIQHPDPDIYDHEDLAILQLLANHITLALHNIRLYDSLKLLNETGQLLTQQLDTEQALQAAVEKIRAVAEADIVILYPYDPKQQRFLHPPRMVGDFYTSQPYLPSKSDGITTLALRHREPIFARDGISLYTTLQGTTQQGNFGTSEKIRSAVALPLRIGEESVGVLFINFRQAQSFKSPQKLLIEGLAHYTAIAIKNALAFGSLSQRRIHELEILQNIDRELTRTLELQPVLNTLLEQAHQHVPAEEASILLYNSRIQLLETEAAIGRHAEASLLQKISLHEMKGITLWVLEHKEPVLVKNVRQDLPWRDLHLQVASDTISELDVPLLDGDEVVGVLNFESIREDAFSREDLDFLVTLSGQAVLAIKNAQAYEREKRLAEESRVLNEVSKEIIGHLDPTSVFNLILEKALEVTNSTRGNLMIYDSDHNDLWMAAERGIVGETIGMRQSLDEGVVGYVAKHKQMLNVDLSQSPWRTVNLALIPGTRSELAVPMLASEDLQGVLNIESLAENYFTERDVHLLQGLADLAVIALQNAEAYEREKRLAVESQVLNEISREITSQLDRSRVFDLILEKALEVTNSPTGTLEIYNPEWNDLELVTERGVLEEKKHERLSLGQGVVGHVARHKQMLNVDPSQSPWNEVFVPAILGTRSELAVPMLAGNELRGVLNVESPLPGNFKESDVRLLQGLAQLAVVVLQNAERYDKAELAAKRSKLLYQAGEELGKITEFSQIDQAYDVILNIVQEYCNGWVVISQYEDDSRELVVIRTSHRQDHHHSLYEETNRRVIDERSTFLIYDIHNPPEEITLAQPLDPRVRSLVATPIEFKERYYGNLEITHKDVGHFVKDDVHFLQGLTQQLASTIYRLETVQERQAFEQRAQSAEEMSSIGESAYEVTHRLGNDLGLVNFYINNIRAELEQESLTSQTISQNLAEISTSVRSVLSFSRDLKNELAKLSEEQALGEPLQIAPRTLLEQAMTSATLPPNVQVALEIDEDVKNIRIIFGRVSDVLHNLIMNAVQALAPKGGKIILRACNSGRGVALEVSDTGVGIPPEKLPKIFDLFFSTKGSSGFGLWSSRRIALKNQGDLKVVSKPGHGTTFTLLLPGVDE